MRIVKLNQLSTLLCGFFGNLVISLKFALNQLCEVPVKLISLVSQTFFGPKRFVVPSQEELKL